MSKFVKVSNSSVKFATGKIIGMKWRILKKIGKGAYGDVYKVQSVEDTRVKAALKAESNDAHDSILKLEVEVLKQLMNRQYALKILHSGKRHFYSYYVMTLCGPDLFKLKQYVKKFSQKTTLRIGLMSLFALKQLHEIGYVHRDIKPCNFALSANRNERLLVYLLDFGLVRRYALKNDKGWQIRRSRSTILLRGTIRYCSVNTHRRGEQGRVDDLWSLMYLILELCVDYLPWGKSNREDKIFYIKESIPDKELLSECNMLCYERILAHLRELHYADRPDYHLIYQIMIEAIKERKISFDEPFDWENAPFTNKELSSAETQSKDEVDELEQLLIEGKGFEKHPDDVPGICDSKYYSSGKTRTKSYSESTTAIKDDEFDEI